VFALVYRVTVKKRRWLETAIVLAVSLSYFAYVFQIPRGEFWRAGLGDWLDPYFINALLEHWYRALATMADPSSPPMFYPATKTLGYSHGLILYAPFYIPLRLFFHPFHANNLTILLVVELGSVCLFLLLRRWFALTFPESLALSAFFFTSQNVINIATAEWAQRASVFLLPPIALVGMASSGMRDGLMSRALAFLSGFLGLLLFTQDFYTGQFALFFAVVAALAGALDRWRVGMARVVGFWMAGPPAAATVGALAALALAWTFYVVGFGGGAIALGGIRITSHDWRRPFVLGCVLSGVFVWLRGWRRTVPDVRLPSLPTPWVRSLALGAMAGCAVFLWIYLPSYLEHPQFPPDHLMHAFRVLDPSRWRRTGDALRDLHVYDTLRGFQLVLAAAILAWVPWFSVDRRTRLVCLASAAISILVWLIPYQYGGFSVWEAIFQGLPGFGPIRDPKRIIQVYELAVVLAIAWVWTRVPAGSLYRVLTSLVVLVLLVTDFNPFIFGFRRPVAVFDRWVGRPLTIVGECRSFYVKGASAAYMSRSDNMWGLYNIDSLFVSLKYSVPTLNGYSAWVPEGWDLGNPQEEVYMSRVKAWVERHQLTGVCELDLDAHTMKPADLAPGS
jgi:hypothetical protein